MQISGYSPSIKQLLDRSGSDKGKWYGGMYEVLLQPSRYAIKSLIEIGIGTFIPNAPSSMVGYASEDYRPGGSLRGLSAKCSNPRFRRRSRHAGDR